MKTIIKLISIFLFTISCYSQYGSEQIWKSGTIDTNKVKVSTLNSTAINFLYDKFQRYEVALYCDSSLKVGLDASFSDGKFILTKAGQWNYLGEFAASQQPDLWLRKAFSENSEVSYQIIVWGAK